MRRNTAIAAAAMAGAALGALLGRRRRTSERRRERADPRADELRRKLAEARQTPPDEEDFEVAGMGAETLVEDASPARPPAPRPAPQASDEPPPADEFEAMRRRIHEEARAAAEEMRRAGEPREH